jgi:ATP-dependent Clp protease ATP-binding subunit ClpA
VHHGVKIKDAALISAAVLSHRYITDRFLPDKAIDLIDEAASKLRMEIDSMPVGSMKSNGSCESSNRKAGCDEGPGVRKNSEDSAGDG